MKKLVTLTALLFFISVKAQQPNWEWAQKIKHENSVFSKVGVDDYGNVFLLSSNNNSYFPYGADSGSVLLKYSQNGDFLWSQKLEGYVAELAVEKTGNVIIAGTFTGEINVGGQTLKSKGYTDCYIQKIHAYGSSIWVNSFHNKNAARIHDVSVSIQGNVYITGEFTDSLNSGNIMLTDTQGLFVGKVNFFGETEWIKGAPTDITQKYSKGMCVAVGKDENIFVLAQKYYMDCNSINCYSRNILKYDAFGNLLLSGSAKFGDVAHHDLTTDPSGNVLLLHGNHTTSNQSFQITKLNDQLEAIWNKVLGTYYSGGQLNQAIAVDQQGDIWVVGELWNYFIAAGVQLDNTYVEKKGEQAILVSQLNSSNGVFMQNFVVGNKYANSATDLAFDKTGNCFVTGYYNQWHNTSAGSDTVCFDHHCLSSGFNQHFLAKLKLSDKVYMDNVGINEASNGLSIKVYPNPSEGEFRVVTEELSKDYTVCVYDVTGVCVYSKKQSNEIDMSNYSKGIYFVEVKAEGKSYRQKVVRN